MTATPETTCPACGNACRENYCPKCGEKIDVRRLSWRTLGDDLLYSFTSMDRGFVFTIKELFSRPGHMMHDYLGGRRRCYFRPFAMMILLAAVYLLLKTWMIPAEGTVSIVVDGAAASPSAFRELIEATIRHPATLSLLLLFAIALVTPWVFRKDGGRAYNYVEYLFIGAYMSSQRFVADLVLLPYLLIPESAGWPDVGYWLAPIYVGLTAWNYKQFFGMRWRRAIPKTIWLMILSFLAAVLVIGVPIALAVAVAEIFF